MSEKITQQIKASGLKLEYVAAKVGINRSTLYRKMTGACEFKASEIEKISLIVTSAEEAE